MPDDDLLAIFNSLDDTPVIRENFIRSAFSYPGSKKDSLEKILPELPHRKGYGEPFGGTGIVLLCRNESNLEVFNDRYAGVTAFYRCVRDKTKIDELINRIHLNLHGREEFIWCKSTWENCEDDVERAARWWYMMTCSFGSQGRHFGRSTKGKAQQGPKLKTNIQYFYPIHHRLQNVQIENQDWRHCLKDYDNEDFVWYLDPTYFDYAKGMYEHEMSREDHKELLERVQHLRGFVALSGYDNDLYNKYEWDAKKTWEVTTSSLGMAYTDTNHLAGKESYLDRSNQKRTEVLWIKESK